MRSLPQLEKLATTSANDSDIPPQGTQHRRGRKTPRSCQEREKARREERRASRGDNWSRSGGAYHLVN